MNPLLISDFETYDKDKYKKFRRNILELLAKIRKFSYDSNYFSLHNFAYLHIGFSILFILIPFLHFFYIFQDLLNIAKNNFMQNIIQEFSIKQIYYFHQINKNYQNIRGNRILKILKNQDVYTSINFDYFIPQTNIKDKFLFFEDFLWKIISNSEYKRILNGFYFSCILLILLLFCILMFKFLDSIYFMKMQHWRLQTIFNILRLILKNLCILIFLTKFDNLFLHRNEFSYIYQNVKNKLFEIDNIYTKEYGFEYSLVFLFLNFSDNLEKLYNLLFRIFIYVIFKFCLLGVLRFYISIRIFLLISFKNKYTIPYLWIYFGVLLLIIPDYNIFNINSNSAIQFSKTSDFKSFCNIFIFIITGIIFLYLYYIKISLLRNFRKKENKIRLGFLSILIIGLLIFISFMNEIVKNKGKIFFKEKNKILSCEIIGSLKIKLYLSIFSITIGLMENFGNVYVSLFYKDYLTEYFPLLIEENHYIFPFTKHIINQKLLKLGINEWKEFS